MIQPTAHERRSLGAWRRRHGPGARTEPDHALGGEPSTTSDGSTAAFMVAGVMLAIASVGLSAHVVGGGPILARRWSLLVELSAWAAVWLLATAVVFRLPACFMLIAVVVGVGVAVRVAALAGPPTTSDDLYRYAWDARVQAAGIDPYAEPPNSPYLLELREGWLWPDAAGCAAIDRPAGCTRINRPAARTIYPPVAEAWFALVGRAAALGSDPSKGGRAHTGVSADLGADGAAVAGSDVGAAHRDKPWQVAGLLTDSATLSLLVVCLRRHRRDVRWVALYALAPFPALEFVNNAHVDSLAVLCTVAALTVAVPPASSRSAPGRAPGRRRWPWIRLARRSTARVVLAALLLSAAALVKLYPALLLVVLVGLRPRQPARAGPAAGVPTGQGGVDTGRSPSRIRVLATGGLTLTVVALVGYLPHIWRVGGRVVGYLPGYLQEERYTTGGRLLLAELVGLPPTAGKLAGALALAAALVWVVARRPPAPDGAAVLIGTVLLVATPVQPWYGGVLLALATIAGQWRWLAVVAAGYPYFFAVILDHGAASGIGQLSYAAALALVGLGLAGSLRAAGWPRRLPAGWRTASRCGRSPMSPGQDGRRSEQRLPNPASEHTR